MVFDGKKYCRMCRELKPLSEYGTHRRKNKATGEYYEKLSYWNKCKPCMRIYNKAASKRRYARRKADGLYYVTQRSRAFISQAEARTLIEKQRNRCRICRKKTKLVVDHCHNRNIFRGMICTKCNTGLGMFEDNTEILQKAIEYLNKFAIARLDPG